MWSPTTPVTGGAETGFTAPTYTLTVDIAPTIQGKQHAVTALGGTQAGVLTHTAADPFTVTFVRPAVFKNLGKTNPVTGLLPSVPKNVWKLIVRKGVLPLAGQPYSTAIAELSLSIPAGSDSADAANLRAMCSLLVGILSQQSAGLGDSLASGIA